MKLTYPAQRKVALTEVLYALLGLVHQREAQETLPHPPEVPLMSLPFDQESTDEHLAAVFAHACGSEIIWSNSISGKRNHAILLQYRGVTRRPAGRDYIDVLTDEGFHSIYLRRILSIG